MGLLRLTERVHSHWLVALCLTVLVALASYPAPACLAAEPATCSNPEDSLPAVCNGPQTSAAGSLSPATEGSKPSAGTSLAQQQSTLGSATGSNYFVRTLARRQLLWADLFAWQAIVQSEHEVAALQFLRRPLAAHDQQSSGPMPWQSRGTQPETELLAVGTAKGALHVFDWQGRLLLDLPQATPGHNDAVTALAFYQKDRASACLIIAQSQGGIRQLTLSAGPGLRPQANQPTPLSASWDDAIAENEPKMPDVTTLVPFRAGLRGQQLVALTSDNMLHVFAVNGTRLLRLQTGEHVLAARMGAPATVNIITPHALLALPLHPPRLVKTLRQLGLLSPPAPVTDGGDQAAAATTQSDDSQQQLLSEDGLHLGSRVGHGHPSACQGLEAREVLVSAAWEESQPMGAKGTANKGPGILPRALGLTSTGDLVRLAMLPGPKGTSACKVRSRAAGYGNRMAVMQPASMHFMAGAYVASTPTVLHLFNTSAYIASPARHALHHSLRDELAAFAIQDDKAAQETPAVLATGSAGQLAVALGPKTIGIYRSSWQSPGFTGGQAGSSGWDMWTRPLFIFVAIGVGVWQFSCRRRQGEAVIGGAGQAREPGGIQALMQGFSDSPRKLAAFQRELETEAIHGPRRVHHSPHSTGLFGNVPSHLSDSTDSE